MEPDRPRATGEALAAAKQNATESKAKESDTDNEAESLHNCNENPDQKRKFTVEDPKILE